MEFQYRNHDNVQPSIINNLSVPASYDMVQKNKPVIEKLFRVGRQLHSIINDAC